LRQFGVPGRVELLEELRTILDLVATAPSTEQELSHGLSLMAHMLVFLEVTCSVGTMEFHEQRRMFLILGDSLWCHQESTTKSHKEWMEDLGLLGSYQDAIRGYSDETGIYAYKGPSWDLVDADAEILKNRLREIARSLDLNYDLEVWAGVKPGLPGTRWPGKRKLGRIKEIVL
jgi:hypothetical protein